MDSGFALSKPAQGRPRSRAPELREVVVFGKSSPAASLTAGFRTTIGSDNLRPIVSLMLPAPLRRIADWLRAYTDNPDPLAATGNLVALVLAGNAPFYPLYGAFVAGTGGMPWLLLTLLSFPFFLAVPALSRIQSRLGRVALALITTGNTVFCTWLIGEPSGIELFLLPCAMLASVLFRPSERLLMLPLAGLPVVAYLFLHGSYGVPPHLYQDTEYAGLLSMNAFSAAMISIFIGMVFARLYADPARS